MVGKIETLKRELHETRVSQGDWKIPYILLMEELFELPILFFALSFADFDPETETSTPLISMEDFGGEPALYVFSDIGLATNWMRHYQHVTDDMKYGLIGAIKKEPNDFLSTFPIAKALGAQLIMLDEGGSFVSFEIDRFMEANRIDPHEIEMPTAHEEAGRLPESKTEPAFRFARVPVIPLK